ncbi:MAG: dephospho-CoA kinase [Anaerolineaceae bacterium]|nr:dephospho-CoA kinase [Anaerolineaceae bacterium]
MSKRAGKYIIGLTGNIGTGKSVVRKMLEHLGAYGIDADALSHRATALGAPGYKPVVETFGRWILDADGQINRARLGRLVFDYPEGMVLLEKIVHPLVSQAVELIIDRSTQPVIVIEAIKLLESDLKRSCDSIWVSYAPPDVQLVRLVRNRNMSEADARQRIAAQPPQEQKVKSANVVIRNMASYEDTWRQVGAAWQKLGPAVQTTAILREAPAAQVGTAPLSQARSDGQGPQKMAEQLSVLRGSPRQSKEIAELINRLRKSGQKLAQDDIMAAFGEKAFLLLQLGQNLVGIIGWQVENLVARTTDMYLDPALSPDQALPALINEMERASKDLQCEASLVFVPLNLARLDSLWKNLGYDRKTPQTLGVQAWKEAARESMPPETDLFFKQLRVDRVLRPI